MGVDHQLLIGTQVKQPAGGIIGARGKGIAIREELKIPREFINAKSRNTQKNLKDKSI